MSAVCLHLTEVPAGDEVAPAGEELIQEEVLVDIVDEEEGNEPTFSKILNSWNSKSLPRLVLS